MSESLTSFQASLIFVVYSLCHIHPTQILLVHVFLNAHVKYRNVVQNMSPCLMTTLVELSVFQAKVTLPRDIRVRVKVGKDSDRSRRGLAAADFFVASLSVQQISNLPTLMTFLPLVKNQRKLCDV